VHRKDAMEQVMSSQLTEHSVYVKN